MKRMILSAFFSILRAITEFPGGILMRRHARSTTFPISSPSLQ